MRRPLLGTLLAATAVGVGLGAGAIGSATGAQQLDPDFGSAGVLILDSDAVSEIDPVLTLTDDGFLITWRCTLDDNKEDMCVSRRDADGSGRTSWGTTTAGVDSMTVVNFGNHNRPRIAALDPEGRTLVGGFCVVGTSADICAARLDAVGALDSTFGPSSDGTVVSDPVGLGKKENILWGTVIDGELLLGGGCRDATNWNLCLLRYDATGTPDSGFSSDGFAINAIGTNQSYIVDAIIDDDGSIIAAVKCTTGDEDLCIVALDGDGAPTALFNGSTNLTADLGVQDVTRSLEARSDGGFIVAGQCKDGSGEWDICTMLVSADGTVVASHRLDMAGNQTMIGSASAITYDDRLLVAATCDGDAGTELCVMRIRPDGTLDTSFGEGGVFTINPSSAPETSGYSLELLTDGFLVTGRLDDADDAVFVAKVIDPTVTPTTTTTSTTTTSTTTTSTTTTSTTTTSTTTTTTSTTSTTLPAAVTTSSTSTTSTSTTPTTSATLPAAVTTSSTSTTSTSTTPTSTTSVATSAEVTVEYEPFALGLAPAVPLGSAVAEVDGTNIELTTRVASTGSRREVRLSAGATTAVFALPQREEHAGIPTGDDIEISADGFAPHSAVLVDISSGASSRVIAEAAVDDVGQTRTTATVPRGLPDGDYVLRIGGRTDDGAVLAISLGVKVSSTPDQLPSTGGGSPTAWALLLAATGMIAVVVRRQATG